MSSSAESRESAVRVLCVSTGEALPERIEAAHGDVVSRAVERPDVAVAAVDDEPIDCVVIADSLPEGDAPSLAASVRAQTETLPIVLLAGDGSEELAMRATRAGVTEYVPTGAERNDTEELVDRVRRLAGRERERRGARRERAQLKRKTRNLESLVDSAPLAIVELDTDGTVLRWNRGAEETFGWQSEEVVGEFNPIVAEDDRSGFEHRLQRLLDGEELQGVEVPGRTKGGEELELLLSAAPVTDASGEPRSITAVLSDITEQKRIEWRLRELQRTAQELNVSPSIETIGEIATDAAADVLGLDVTGIWRYDERENALVPIAVTSSGAEVAPEVPRFTPGNSLAWEVFDSGEVRAYGDLSEVEGRYNPDSIIRSEILVPLGEYGVLVTGSRSPQQFSETDVDLFRILGATVEAAMVRAYREEELRLQNERLDEFADVVAHDLRNPLSVAKGFLDLAEESGDPEQFEKVRSAHDRIGQLIDDLLTLAQGEATVESRETIDVGDAAERAWKLVDTDGATLSVREPPTISGDPSRLRQLFENLFRNSVEHGSTGNRTESGDSVEHGSTGSQTQSDDSVEHGNAPEDAGDDGVTVTVGELADEAGFYVEDDGVGIRPERRELVLDHGVTFSDDGTGFGLSIVSDIARAHGWTVDVGESDAGGARFEFRLSG